MAAHIGLGPVFVFEWRRASRRWQMYGQRSLLLTCLLAGIYIVWSPQMGSTSLRALAHVGQSVFMLVIYLQLTLVLFAAPAATAGAVCLDRRQGTLLPLLATDLSSAEILLGKLAARLVPMLGLIIICVPVLFLLPLLGGVDPRVLLGAILVMAGAAVLGSSLALTLSVCGNRPHEVLLASYLLLAVVFLPEPVGTLAGNLLGFGIVPAWLAYSNPYWVAFAPYWTPGTTGWRESLYFLGGCLVVSVILLSVAAKCLRSESVRREDVSTAKPGALYALRARFFRPLLDLNPILWLAWRGGRGGPWGRVLWGIYAGMAVLSTLGVILPQLQPTGFQYASLVVGYQVAVGLLLLTAITPGCSAADRDQATLDMLLTTPLSTRSIVRGQWCGVYGIVLLLAIAPCVVAGILALNFGHGQHLLLLLALILTYGAAFASLGLYLGIALPRLERAVTIGVGVYVLVWLGWPMALKLVVGSGRVAGGITGAPLLLALGCLAGVSTLGFWLVRLARRSSRAAARTILLYVVLYTACTMGMLGCIQAWDWRIEDMARKVYLAGGAFCGTMGLVLAGRTAPFSLTSAARLAAYVIWAMAFMPLIIWAAIADPFIFPFLASPEYCTNEVLGKIQDGRSENLYLSNQLFWIVGYASVAWLLFQATVGAFDHYLGRMRVSGAGHEGQ